MSKCHVTNMWKLTPQLTRKNALVPNMVSLNISNNELSKNIYISNNEANLHLLGENCHFPILSSRQSGESNL